MKGVSRTGESGLIAGFLRGDAEAISIVDGWIDAVVRSSFSSLRSEWDDLRQEIRMRVFRNLSSSRFDSRSSLRTYVQRISRYTCIDATRLASRRRERPETGADEHVSRVTANDITGGCMSRDLYLKLLEKLPEGDRLLLDLVFGRNCSYAEVAKRLGVSEGAIKVRMFRCKERLVKAYSNLVKR